MAARRFPVRSQLTMTQRAATGPEPRAQPPTRTGHCARCGVSSDLTQVITPQRFDRDERHASPAGMVHAHWVCAACCGALLDERAVFNRAGRRQVALANRPVVRLR